jgi:hypothetical protein
MKPEQRKAPCQNCRRGILSALTNGAWTVERGCCGTWRLVGGKISR